MSELVEAAETAEKIVEDVAEVVAIPNVKAVAAAALVGGLVAGAGLGYFVARKKLETKYAAISDAEIDDMREHFNKKEAAREAEANKPDLEELQEKAVAANAEYAKKSTTPPTVSVQPLGPPVPQTPVTVFEQAETVEPDIGWDYAIELKRRNGDEPYVIHRDEMGEKGDHYESITLTYYEEDDILADIQDHVVDDRSILGDENLQRWGQGSGDPNVVIIRNEELDTEFEIARSHGSYAEEVHGFLKHEEPMRRRRQRFDDE